MSDTNGAAAVNGHALHVQDGFSYRPVNYDAELKIQKIEELRIRNEQRKLKLERDRKELIHIAEFHSLSAWLFEINRAAIRAHVKDEAIVDAIIRDTQRALDERFETA